MARNITVGIDIGTYQVKVVVCERVENSLQGKNAAKIIATGISESKGLRHGYIIHESEVVHSIKSAVAMAEKTAGVKIRKAFIAVGGIGLASITSSSASMVTRADQEVSELDLEKLSLSCEQELSPALIQNRRILHSIPLSYKIDGKVVLSKTPLGMKGSRLEVKMLFVTCLESHLNDLLSAVESAGIEVEDVLASPIAGSFCILSKSQKIAGALLANIGAETISIVVFENNIPISLEVFPIGSTDITNDIALGLKIPLEEAENIKIGAIGQTSFSKKKLEEIIHARLSDMFELIESHLKKIGRNGLLPAGIFITGGGAGVGSIEDFAKLSLKLPSRIGTLNLGEKNRVKDSTWAVAYGLCLLGFSKEEKRDLGMKSRVNHGAEKLFGWIKQFLP